MARTTTGNGRKPNAGSAPVMKEQKVSNGNGGDARQTKQTRGVKNGTSATTTTAAEKPRGGRGVAAKESGTNGAMMTGPKKSSGRGAAAKETGTNGATMTAAKKSNGLGRGAAAKGTGMETNGARSGENAVALLKRQHQSMRQIFEQVQGAQRRMRSKPFDLLVVEMAIHFELEERIFYPSLKKKQTAEMLMEAVEEHLSAKRVLADLIDLDPSDARWPAKVEVMRVLFEQHVAEEETRMLPQAERMLGDAELRRIGVKLIALEKELRGAGAPELRQHVTEHIDIAAPI